MPNCDARATTSCPGCLLSLTVQGTKQALACSSDVSLTVKSYFGYEHNVYEVHSARNPLLRFSCRVDFFGEAIRDKVMRNEAKKQELSARSCFTQHQVR